MWMLVPLGNPGPEYQDTRHNMGRLMLQRWIANRDLQPPVKRKFPSGTLYGLTDQLQALVPSTYMNLSGEVCIQADEAGIWDFGTGSLARRMILLCDDKDLPLGLGRFRMEGGDGGHNGLKSIFHHLGTPAIARLRLGIGPFERPLHDFVLGVWTEPEWKRIEALDAPFSAFMKRLSGTEDLGLLPSEVNGERFWMPD